jgi:hypothetical protein
VEFAVVPTEKVVGGAYHPKYPLIYIAFDIWF